MNERYLIVGLGNPGSQYEDTRHNIGFRVVKAFAAKHAIVLKPALIRAKGSLGIGQIAEKKVDLLLPITYMNQSGLAVRKCVNYYKLSKEQILVVTDDVALPFGQLRLRAKGSCGGHNGLKSIEAHLGSEEYPRLRIGVGDRERGELADYVLGRFTSDEQRELPEVVDRVVKALELWLEDGIETAMLEVNRSK